MELISDRYEILGLDSEENIVSGKLYKARDLLEGVFVYIQLIKDNIYMNEKFLPNLIDEAVILNEINSNNIARVLDLGIYLGSEERYFYIVNEYFSGIELKKIINGNYMDLSTVVTITNKVLKTLEEAYKHNLYHGGLTEENIFIDENYNLKIYDFCITKANKGVNIRKENCIEFLSPYQLNIDFTDRQSDFFTLGIILFNAIFNKMPFGSAKDEKEMLKLINKGIDWNHIVINNENIVLVNIIKKLTGRNEKYESVHEILVDLSEFMYTKANIKEDEVEYVEGKKLDILIDKYKNKTLQKIIIAAVTFTMLGAFIYQFS